MNKEGEITTSEKVLFILRLFLIAPVVVIAVLVILGFVLAISAAFAIAVLLFIFVEFPIILFYIVKVQSMRLKEEEQKRIEVILKEKEDLEEKILGCIRVTRRTGSILGYSIIQEVLVITPNKVLVEGIRAETPQFGGGGTIDNSHQKFAIPKSEITEIKLNKLLQVTLKITTRERDLKWWVKGFIPKKKGVKLVDYENMLRPVFGDKLSVKK